MGRMGGHDVSGGHTLVRIFLTDREKRLVDAIGNDIEKPRSVVCKKIIESFFITQSRDEILEPEGTLEAKGMVDEFMRSMGLE